MFILRELKDMPLKDVESTSALSPRRLILKGRNPAPKALNRPSVKPAKKKWTFWCQGKKYWRIWQSFAHASFQEAILLNPFSSSLFLLGKLLRFISFFIFLLIAVGGQRLLGPFNRDQIVVFFLVFNLIDIATQALFRGVYWFRGMIVSGSFDHFLLKPLHPLFNVLTRYTDFLDVITLIPVIIYLIYFSSLHQLVPGWLALGEFLILLVFALFIGLAFHIFSLSVGVLSTEVDSIIWMWRNLANMTRVPVDIYAHSIRFILVYILPVGVMITFPAKALLGLLSWQNTMLAIVISIFTLALTLRFWRFALTKYSSASS